jgi:hypothetical protein
MKLQRFTTVQDTKKRTAGQLNSRPLRFHHVQHPGLLPRRCGSKKEIIQGKKAVVPGGFFL